MAIRSRILAGSLRPAAILGVALAAACGPSGPVLELEWTGADTGRATLVATARQCEGNPLELMAISGDTGVAIGLFGEGVGTAGTYQIREPGVVSGRGATLGARWLDSAAVKAYRATSGSVTLTGAAPELAGRFSAEARQAGEAAPVAITGSFRGVTVAGCGG